MEVSQLPQKYFFLVIVSGFYFIRKIFWLFTQWHKSTMLLKNKLGLIWNTVKENHTNGTAFFFILSLFTQWKMLECRFLHILHKIHWQHHLLDLRYKTVSEGFPLIPTYTNFYNGVEIKQLTKYKHHRIQNGLLEILKYTGLMDNTRFFFLLFFFLYCRTVRQKSDFKWF